MALLGLAIVPNNQGQMVVVRMDTSEINTMVLASDRPPIYWYSVDPVQKGPQAVTNDLLKVALQMGGNPQNTMEPEDLHVTMWYSHCT